jgi:hypothetical protein
MTTKPPVWILIDGTNTVHRDAHGVGIHPCAETIGRRLELMIDKWDPACVITAWDSPEPTLRAFQLRRPSFKTAATT